jgi:hypothetical protein
MPDNAPQPPPLTLALMRNEERSFPCRSAEPVCGLFRFRPSACQESASTGCPSLLRSRTTPVGPAASCFRDCAGTPPGDCRGTRTTGFLAKHAPAADGSDDSSWASASVIDRLSRLQRDSGRVGPVRPSPGSTIG